MLKLHRNHNLTRDKTIRKILTFGLRIQNRSFAYVAYKLKYELR